MRLKSILTLFLIAAAMTTDTAYACTETGRNCQYSYECCSGACSAAFKYCLHR
ncbi:ORF127 [Xestia c-nigrum granulovirus]|uniref:ORF127 n=1 Tax=Xestia c-nigrum granulosis virus TaxID=51677 RepID=Q9PYR8_GVXN|nr:ORF127 [Xestia c-nigrum granulovirus]AAF05241.1 ORF127 [Xestia c-nigrum granulovirus]